MSKKIPVHLTLEQIKYLFNKIGNGKQFLNDDELKLAELLDEIINLNEEKFEKRLAKCSYGCSTSTVESNPDLAFFQPKPDEDFDRYYCGCYGWD